MILFRAKVLRSDMISTIFPAIAWMFLVSESDNFGHLITRNIQFYSDKINIQTGYYYASYGNYTVDDGILIPERIYGFK